MVIILSPTFSVGQLEINGAEVVKYPPFGNSEMNNLFVHKNHYSCQSLPLYTPKLCFFHSFLV